MPARRTTSSAHASSDGQIARNGQAGDDGMIEMHVQLARINEKLAGLPDHEARIRVLEATKAKLLGACIALGAIAGGVSGWLGLVITHH